MTLTLMARLFVMLAVAVILGASSFATSFAQQDKVTFKTSSANNMFFGEGLLQVVITDQQSDNDAIIEKITVNIDAIPDSGTAGSDSFSIPETSASSGRFEFYLMHVDADEVDPNDIDPINTAGIEGADGAGASAAPIITFGQGSADLIVAGADLFEGTRFEITIHDTQFELDYQETEADLSLDRTAYGSSSFVYVYINDSDANLNPTAPDRFTVDPTAAPNNDLLALDGGTITQSVVFEETGDNTAVFKGRYQLGSSITTGGNKAFILTLHDKANYVAALSADENDSNNIDQVSFTIGDTSGRITVNEGQNTQPRFDPEFSSDKPEYRLGDTVRLTITDRDADSNADTVDTIQLTASAQEGQDKTFSATETGANTGVFSLAFKLSSTQAEDTVVVGSSDKLIIRYIDDHPTGSTSSKEFTYTIRVDKPDASGAVNSGSPAIKDITGKTLPSIQVDQQVILATTVENTGSQEQPFIALVEVRDSAGATVFLQWQSGIIGAGAKSEIGLSWTPSKPGTYEVRTFAISDLANPQILSQVAKSSVIVS